MILSEIIEYINKNVTSKSQLEGMRGMGLSLDELPESYRAKKQRTDSGIDYYICNRNETTRNKMYEKLVANVDKGSTNIGMNNVASKSVVHEKTQAVNIEEKIKICKACGAILQDNALFCHKCGEKYEETQQKNRDEDEKDWDEFWGRVNNESNDSTESFDEEDCSFEISMCAKENNDINNFFDSGNDFNEKGYSEESYQESKETDKERTWLEKDYSELIWEENTKFRMEREVYKYKGQEKNRFVIEKSYSEKICSIPEDFRSDRIVSVWGYKDDFYFLVQLDNKCYIRRTRINSKKTELIDQIDGKYSSYGEIDVKCYLIEDRRLCFIIDEKLCLLDINNDKNLQQFDFVHEKGVALEHVYTDDVYVFSTDKESYIFINDIQENSLKVVNCKEVFDYDDMIDQIHRYNMQQCFYKAPEKYIAGCKPGEHSLKFDLIRKRVTVDFKPVIAPLDSFVFEFGSKAKSPKKDSGLIHELYSYNFMTKELFRID